MPRPGTAVALLDTPGAISVASDTGTWFVVGLTDRGPLTPVLIHSLDHFVSVFGDRQTYSVLYDCIDNFFREGGNLVYVQRAVGPTPTTGTRNLLDSGSGISLVVSGIGPGAWSANYKVAVVAGTGSNYQINVTTSAGVVLENSGDLADQQSAVNWALNSSYVRIALGATALVPAVAAGAALSAGTDDRTNITDTQYQNALNAFTSDLGPGQVSIPGRTTSTAFGQLITHAETYGRVALLDLTDSASAATLESAVSTLTSRFAAAFAPWVQIPGLTTGTYRVVPASSFIAGLLGRNDPALGPDTPAAGRNGISRWATGLSQVAWDDATRTAMNTAGVDVIRLMNGAVKVYGWRSLADPINDAGWLDFGNGRLFMAINAELDAAAENWVFADIDGQSGATIGGLHDDLAAVLKGFYDQNQLFGTSPDEAFAVDTGPNVNTLATIAALELHATCYVKMAPFAEYVSIRVVKRQITESIV